QGHARICRDIAAVRFEHSAIAAVVAPMRSDLTFRARASHVDKIEPSRAHKSAQALGRFEAKHALRLAFGMKCFRRIEADEGHIRYWLNPLKPRRQSDRRVVDVDRIAVDDAAVSGIDRLRYGLRQRQARGGQGENTATRLVHLSVLNRCAVALPRPPLPRPARSSPWTPRSRRSTASTW